MDDFVPKSGAHVKLGHDPSDLSIRGIVIFGILLAVFGLLAFVGVRVILAPIPYISIPWRARKGFPGTKSAPGELTPAQQPWLHDAERGAPQTTGRERARRPQARR